MEEVDNIILITLRQIGTKIAEGITSLKELETDAFVEGCALCINSIRGEGEEALPTTLPQHMSAKFRAGTSLANACKGLGYPDDIGFNTFLYSNENDCRRLLMWLVERLPKDSSEESGQAFEPGAMLDRAIGTSMGQWLSHTWIPPTCKKDNITWHGEPEGWFLEGTRAVNEFNSIAVRAPYEAAAPGVKLSKDKKRYFESSLNLLTSQPPLQKQVASSLIEANSVELAKAREWENMWSLSGLSEEEYRNKKKRKIKEALANKMRTALIRAEAASKKEISMLEFLEDFANNNQGVASSFAHKEKLQFANDSEDVLDGVKPATEEELQKQREEELDALQLELDELLTLLGQLEIDSEKFTSGISKLQLEAEKEKEKSKEQEEIYKMRKKVLDLLPNADENIQKLQDVVDTSAQRLTALAEKWEGHRTKLLAEYRKLKTIASGEKDDAQQQLGKIKVLREEMKALAESVKGKESIYKQLVTEHERMKKDINRSSYTKRIMEIVKNINKQKADIAKVLVDTRVLQKDINGLSEKLNRTFSVTDELIFKNAKGDEASKQSYKYLAELHDNCSALISTVESTGSIMREIRELEEQIDSEQQKNMTNNVERIMKDYKEIKKENTKLIQQLKG